MALEGDRELLRGHPLAIILDSHQGGSAVTHVDPDRRRPSIEAVLDQLLHDRGRPFDDLAGGDLVHQGVGEHPNPTGLRVLGNYLDHGPTRGSTTRGIDGPHEFSLERVFGGVTST